MHLNVNMLNGGKRLKWSAQRVDWDWRKEVHLRTPKPCGFLSAARIEQTVQEITPLHSHKLGLLNTMARSLLRLIYTTEVMHWRY